MQQFAIMLYLLGLILLVIGAIGLIIDAFREGFFWGLGCLLLAPVVLAFVVFHWEQAKQPFLIGVIGFVMIFVAVFMSSGPPLIEEPGYTSKPKEPEKGIAAPWEEDDRRLRAEPQFKDPPKPISPAQPGSGTVQQTEPTEPPKPTFKKLSEIEEVQAQGLINVAIQERKMGRLPGTGYKKMVDSCREIIQRWPESIYAFQAKRALADLPLRYHKMYNITKEEIDLGNLK
ncbi:MAG: hypothetical protein ACYSYV_11065 [Planctomycetota bacterium]|jgi:hypothetical protein